MKTRDAGDALDGTLFKMGVLYTTDAPQWTSGGAEGKLIRREPLDIEDDLLDVDDDMFSSREELEAKRMEAEEMGRMEHEQRMVLARERIQEARKAQLERLTQLEQAEEESKSPECEARSEILEREKEIAERIEALERDESDSDADVWTVRNADVVTDSDSDDTLERSRPVKAPRRKWGTPADLNELADDGDAIEPPNSDVMSTTSTAEFFSLSSSSSAEDLADDEPARCRRKKMAAPDIPDDLSFVDVETLQSMDVESDAKPIWRRSCSESGLDADWTEAANPGASLTARSLSVDVRIEAEATGTLSNTDTSL